MPLADSAGRSASLCDRRLRQQLDDQRAAGQQARAEILEDREKLRLAGDSRSEDRVGLAVWHMRAALGRLADHAREATTGERNEMVEMAGAGDHDLIGEACARRLDEAVDQAGHVGVRSSVEIDNVTHSLRPAPQGRIAVSGAKDLHRFA